MSHRLVTLAFISLVLGAVCALLVGADIAMGRRQHMAVMNIVWPVTALYAGPLALLAYFGIGRGHAAGPRTGHAAHSPCGMKRPSWQAALLGTTHCGAGCTLGDVATDGGLYVLGLSAALGSPLVTAYVFDFIAAYLLGIVFQYFAIAPMKQLPPGKALWAAIKADTLSLLAFQVGMYAWMAIYQKAIFHPRLEANSPVYWFMMQLGMLAGFVTSYPMNWFLVRKGIKEAM